MAGEYGVNIRMSVTGQEKLDQIKKKTDELNASINKMKGINLSGNFPFTKGEDVKPLKDAKAQMKAAKKITDPALMTTGEALVSDLASLAVESNNDFFKKLVSGGIEMSGAVVKGLADLSDQGVSKILGANPVTQDDAKTSDFY